MEFFFIHSLDMFGRVTKLTYQGRHAGGELSTLD
jgi:hypothetical protein